MPELPEVETSRREVMKSCRGRTIVSVFAKDDRIVFDGIVPRTFAAKMKGRRIVGSGRHGKQYWLVLDKPPFPIFHYGMTGWMDVYRDALDRPRFCKMELLLDDGTRIGYRDPRRLGRIRLRKDPEHEPPVSELGFDPLNDMESLDYFRDAFAIRKAPVKAVLLDQKFCAGIGNWIADEICYQTKVDPRKRANEMALPEIRRVRKKLTDIIAHAVKVGADDSKFPRIWLFHYRWGKKAAVDGKGRSIEFITVGGRTTAWVPEIISKQISGK